VPILSKGGYIFYAAMNDETSADDKLCNEHHTKFNAWWDFVPAGKRKRKRKLTGRLMFQIVCSNK